MQLHHLVQQCGMLVDTVHVARCNSAVPLEPERTCTRQSTSPARVCASSIDEWVIVELMQTEIGAPA